MTRRGAHFVSRRVLRRRARDADGVIDGILADLGVRRRWARFRRRWARFRRRGRPHLYELLNPVGNCAVDRLDQDLGRWRVEHPDEPIRSFLQDVVDEVEDELTDRILAELAKPVPPFMRREPGSEWPVVAEPHPGPLLGRLPARWPGSGAPMTWDGLPVTQGPNGELYVTGSWPTAQRFPVERLDPAELDDVMRSPGPLMPGTDE